MEEVNLDRARLLPDEELMLIPGLGRKGWREVRESLPADRIRITADIPLDMLDVVQQLIVAAGGSMEEKRGE